MLKLFIDPDKKNKQQNNRVQDSAVENYASPPLKRLLQTLVAKYLVFAITLRPAAELKGQILAPGYEFSN